jgi:hypothetical protein
MPSKAAVSQYGPRRLIKSTIQQNDDFSSLHAFPFSWTGVLGNQESVAFLLAQ